MSSPAAQQRPLAALGGTASSRRGGHSRRVCHFPSRPEPPGPGKGPPTRAPCRAWAYRMSILHRRLKGSCPSSLLYTACNFHYNTAALGPRRRRPQTLLNWLHLTLLALEQRELNGSLSVRTEVLIAPSQDLAARSLNKLLFLLATRRCPRRLQEGGRLEDLPGTNDRWTQHLPQRPELIFPPTPNPTPTLTSLLSPDPNPFPLVPPFSASKPS